MPLALHPMVPAHALGTPEKGEIIVLTVTERTGCALLWVVLAIGTSARSTKRALVDTEKGRDMLINLISGKGVIAALIAITGGVGATVIVHSQASAKQPVAVMLSTRSNANALANTKTASNSPRRTHQQSTTPATSNTTTTSGFNNGLASGASIHGLCVAYRAHLMANARVTSNLESHLAQSKAFLGLAQYATAKGETIATLCATQGGVKISPLPTSHANAAAKLPSGAALG
ncbi:MAG: hypothetical protein ACYCTG_02115 [Ferrimicrobium sp.]